MSVDSSVEVEKTEYKGWKNCYRVSNGEVELIVTADVGPWIIRYGFIGGQNLLKEYTPNSWGKSREDILQLRGGHRVWKAPEDPVASWVADNVPVAVTVVPCVLTARALVEPLTGFEKEIAVTLLPEGSHVEVSNRFTNRGSLALEFSPWSLTMMAQRGVAVIGLPSRGRHPAELKPTNPLVMWTYTDLSDKRWTFTKKYIVLQQDPGDANPQKTGLFTSDSWAAYFLGGEAFLKRAGADPVKTYLDFGCSVEVFTNDECLELEIMGPLTKVQPGETVEQVENWALHENVVLTGLTDDALDGIIAPLLLTREASMINGHLDLRLVTASASPGSDDLTK